MTLSGDSLFDGFLYGTGIVLPLALSVLVTQVIRIKYDAHKLKS